MKISMITKATTKKTDIHFIHFASRSNPFSLKLIARNPFDNANKPVINKTAKFKFPFTIDINAIILTSVINKPAIQFRFIYITPLKKVGATCHRLFIIILRLLFRDVPNKISVRYTFVISTVYLRLSNIMAMQT